MTTRRYALSLTLALVFLVPSAVRAGLMTAHSWEVTGTQANGALGNSGNTACDLDGDGHPDVIVGASVYDTSATDAGKVFVYMGTSSGPSTTAAWTAESVNASDDFGIDAACADFNGDGYADLAISADGYDVGGMTDAGAVFVWYGGPAGPGNPSGLGPNGTPSNADWSTLGTQAGEFYGNSIADAGDVNKDGLHELIVGASEYSGSPLESTEGRAFVYLGAHAGLPTTPSWTAESNQPYGGMGARVASAGDVNNDGYGDIIIGSCYEPPLSNPDCIGRAFVYLGSAAGLGPSGTPSNADWFADGDGVGLQFGYELGGAGDVNGDGYGDIIIGAPYEVVSGMAGAGRVYVWFGGPSGTGNPSGLGPNGNPANADWKAEGDQANGHFGGWVGRAGNVNGDAYADIWVASFRYSPGGLTDAGGAWVWLGRAGGLGPTGTPSNANWVVHGEAAGDDYGSVSWGGSDLNGDGFGDFIVTAPGSTVNGVPGAGEAYAYYGTCGSADGDGDGVAPSGAPGCTITNLTDCNDADGTSWSTPEEVSGLLFADKATLNWTPAETGTAEGAMRYDVLRSGQPSDFLNGTLCVATNTGPAATATDTATPLAASGFFYLPRARNGCATLGSLGTTSSNQQRAGRTCP